MTDSSELETYLERRCGTRCFSVGAGAAAAKPLTSGDLAGSWQQRMEVHVKTKGVPCALFILQRFFLISSHFRIAYREHKMHDTQSLFEICMSCLLRP